MPVVNCPSCARRITLTMDELTMLVECAACSSRFYPVRPPDGVVTATVPPAVARCSPRSSLMHIDTERAAERLPATEALLPQSSSSVPGSARLRPRRKKKRTNVLAVVAIVMGALALTIGLTLGLLAILWNNCAQARSAGATPGENAATTGSGAVVPPLTGAPPPPLTTPDFRVAPAPMPPAAVAVPPPMPLPDGCASTFRPNVDLVGALPTGRPGTVPAPK